MSCVVEQVSSEKAPQREQWGRHQETSEQTVCVFNI